MPFDHEYDHDYDYEHEHGIWGWFVEPADDTEMKIYDVTLTLHEQMPGYPGDPLFCRRMVTSIARGHSSNLALLTMGSHAGTHVDAPRHFYNCAAGVDALATEVLVGPCLVCRMAAGGMIDRRHLACLKLKGVTRVLFKTGNSRFVAQRPFRKRFTALTGAAAAYLVACGVKLVGIDYFSVDQYQSGTHPAHRVLIGAGVAVIEGLDLRGVPPGRYELFCGPLKIKDGDGAPARVFLRSVNRGKTDVENKKKD